MTTENARQLTAEQLALLREAFFNGNLLFDPRDPSQKLDDRSTWKRSHNTALFNAFIAMASCADVNWKEVARLADICDEPVPLVSTPGSPSGLRGSRAACIMIDDLAEDVRELVAEALEARIQKGTRE